jgi:lipid-A-disaccharide synthase
LLEQETKSKIDLSSIISNDKKIISLFSGSRSSEVNLILPILIEFVNLMNKKFDNFTFVFHATDENKDLISEKINNLNLKNVEVISDENIKKQIITKSTFAVSKSGTISLEICNAKVPFITIYKMNFLNFLIVKMLVKIKFANIINIINNKEIIPELIQKECNAKEIYNSVVYFLKNPELMKKQINDCEETLTKIRSKTSSSNEAAFVLSNFLIG